MNVEEVIGADKSTDSDSDDSEYLWTVVNKHYKNRQYNMYKGMKVITNKGLGV
jgi:hypothetical protein